MEKYSNMADFFIATLSDEDLKNKLLSCKTLDEMYDFVSKCCSDTFSKEEFKIFISKMIKNHLVDKKVPDSSLQKVSGGTEGILDKTLGFVNRRTGNFFTLKSNDDEGDKNPVSKLRAYTTWAKESTELMATSYKLVDGMFDLYSNLKNSGESEELEILKDELYDLQCMISEAKKNKQNK